jgi:hypothetical protein
MIDNISCVKTQDGKITSPIVSKDLPQIRWNAINYVQI